MKLRFSSLLVVLAAATVACRSEAYYASQPAGALTLTVELPVPGAEPQLTVTGPGGFQRTLSGAGTLGDLPAGSYEIRAAPMTSDGEIWEPVDSVQRVNVGTTGSPLTVAIRYRTTTGKLVVTLEGLPASWSPGIRVTGPSSYNQVLPASAIISGLKPGVYTLTAVEQTVGAVVLEPVPAITVIGVAASTLPAWAKISFVANSAPINVSITGLPTGVPGSVVLRGPTGVLTSVTNTQLFQSMTKGDYLATESSVTWFDNTWTPAEPLKSFALSAEGATLAVHYASSTGLLALAIDGLPDGIAGAVTVTGPGFSQSVPADVTLGGLAPGTYTVTASVVTAGVGTFVPGAATLTVDIAAGAVADGSVTYGAAVSGSLRINVSGVPSNLNADITVTGPGGFVRSIGGTATFNGLAAGSYAITAASVASGASTYNASPASQSITVTAGATATTDVSYSLAAPIMGALAVNVTGVPSDLNADITVTGPGGYVHSIGGTATFNGLAPGSYTVTAASVASGASTYNAAPPTQTIAVIAGNTATTAVSYSLAAPTTGGLTLTVTGLPGALAADITVTGPGGFVAHPTATATLTGLTPGSYQVTATSVTSGTSTYNATPASQAITVTAGATASGTVTYALAAPTTGGLTLTVTGLPGTTPAIITVTGPGGFIAHPTATATITGLVPGSYVVAATSVTAGTSTYNAAPASQTIPVSAGATASGAVTYSLAAPTTGGLALTISGLPGALAAGITVSGPGGFVAHPTATATLTGLAPGSYLIAATSVISGSSTYNAAPASQTIAVTAGNTATGSVVYSLAAAATGNLTVTVTGLPLLSLASVTVSGPGGFSRLLTATTTITGLVPGTYTISSVTVLGLYLPIPLSQTVAVVSGATASKSVSYGASGAPAAAIVSVDTTNRLQVMKGWEATPQSGQASAGFSIWQMPLMDMAINDLGLNRVRLAVKATAEPINDNSNPNVINPAGFDWSTIDQLVQLIVMPLRQRSAARGEQLYVNLNYTAFNGTGAFLTNPAEYAELMLATFQHLQSQWGFVPDGIEMILEPDNGTLWTDGTKIGLALKAAGDRLAAAGFHPEFIGPSVTNMANTLPYLDAMVQVPGVLQYLKEVSYHRYGGVSDANLAAIKSRAAQYGLRTAMLEHIGSGVEDLYKDLTLANASAWQQYTIAYPTSDNGAQYYVITGNTFVMGSRTPALRQYFRYVRMGAQRVGAVSSTGITRPVAFTNPGGGMAVVLHLDSPGDVVVNGMRPGVYGVEMTTPAGVTIQLPDVNTQGTGSARVSPTQLGVLTLYRR